MLTGVVCGGLGGVGDVAVGGGVGFEGAGFGVAGLDRPTRKTITAARTMTAAMASRLRFTGASYPCG